MPATSTLPIEQFYRTKMILYSDLCGGQNRNINMVCL